MKNRIIYVGSQYLGHTPDDGETMKNQLMREAIAKHVDSIIPIDLRNRPVRKWYLVKFVLCLLFLRRAKVLVSASVYVAGTMLRVCRILGKRKGVYYWVVGGLFDKLLVSGELDINHYRNLEKIIVQTKDMEENLRKAGLTQVMTVPNSKRIPTLPEVHKKDKARRFVFMSRVTKEKGVEYIIEAIKNIRKKGDYEPTVDFYGRLDSDYQERFKELIDGDNSLNYYGVLDMTSFSGYEKLAEYDMMLFPSFHPGEGFPGIAIDAFIAGLPIISSDWHENAQVIENGRTGVIIPTHHQEALEGAIMNACAGRYNLAAMSKNAQAEASKYDIKNVITPVLLNQIGLINHNGIVI